MARKIYVTAALAAAVGFAAPAHAGFILVQDRAGPVYKVDTVGTNDSIFRSLADVPSTQPANSPNALGTNLNDSGLYRTQFPDVGDAAEFYRDDDLLGTLPVLGNGIAAGDVLDDTYYYIDRSSRLRSVDNISALDGTNTPVADLIRDLGDLETLGDLAVAGGPGQIFISHNDAAFSVVDTDGTKLTTVTASNRYAGLAFAGGDLFGVTGGNNSVSDLYALSFTGTALTETFVRTLDGIRGTDASVVPLPAAAWMFLGGIGAAGAYNRYLRRKKDAAENA